MCAAVTRRPGNEKALLRSHREASVGTAGRSVTPTAEATAVVASAAGDFFREAERRRGIGVLVEPEERT